MISFLSLFSSCNQPKKIDNKYLTASIPKNYTDMTDFRNNDILFLDHVMKNDLESIFSIDNIQDLTIQANAQTIKDFTPVEILTTRLKLIEEDTQDPNFGWHHFQLIKQPKAMMFKGYKAAEATFTVKENIGKAGRIIEKKIIRMVVFTENDLWNFVLSPSASKNYESEMTIFKGILESIEIKK